MYDLVILGAGPAGLAASAYALRKGIEFVTVTEALGGKGGERISFPGAAEHRVLRPEQLLADFRRELEYLAERHRRGRARQVVPREGGLVITVETDDGSHEIRTRSAVVATGTRLRRLGVPGELELAGRALGYSAVSYSHVLHGRDVFIYGDGRRSVDSALEVSRHARSVTVLLERVEGFRELYRHRLQKANNVTMLDDCSISGFGGEDFCRSVRLAYRNGEPREIEADAFFIELQPKPNSEMVADLAELDEHGFIVVDLWNRTSAPGVFAAGDVTAAGFEQSLVAVGEGVKALISAYSHLHWGL